MKIEKEQILVSPSDLNNFVNCSYHTLNDLQQDEKGLLKKEASEDMKLWRKYGHEHEKKYLDKFKKEYPSNVTIDPKQTDDKRYKDTIEALNKGYDLIYKAFLIDGDFRGESDFLIKTKDQTNLGDYGYEVYDTKITKNLKPSHVLQITSYSFFLSKITETLPKKMFLIDGSDKINAYNVKEFIDYFSFAKSNFDFFLDKKEFKKLYPEKCDHCSVCDWKDVCIKRWDDDDYINQIYKIRKTQVVKLKEEGLDTIEKFANTDLDKIKSKINKQTKEKLHHQARLHNKKRLTGKSDIQFIQQIPGHGFYKMPEPNEGDIHFDIEGFIRPNNRNFEYLHGVYFKENGKGTFKHFFVNDYKEDEELRIFKELVNFFKQQFEKYPNAYIYHYNNYETQALKELASNYSGKFPEGYNVIDDLLRKRKFVDLYKIVQYTFQTTEKDLSLKTLEQFYRKDRSAEIKTAAESIRLFDIWSTSKNEKVKQNIIDYNEEDCISTSDLRDFLKEKKPDDIPWFDGSIKDTDEDDQKKIKEKETTEEIERKELELIENLNNSNHDEQLKNKLIDLVGFHRREKKPENWRYYKRLEETHEDLIDDNECLANCSFVKKELDTTSGNTNYIYQFETQNYKINVGDSAKEIFENKSYGKITSIVEQDDDTNFIEITSNKSESELPKIFTFSYGEYFNTNRIRDSLNLILSETEEKKKAKYKCALDILEDNFPNIKNIKKGDSIINTNNDLNEEAIKAVKNLNSSYLLIQGPPGAGKTYLSGKMILELIKDGKKVGVTSNSHSAINTLLKQVEEFAEQEKFELKGMKRNSKPEHKLNGQFIKDGTSGKKLDLTNSLFAGTAWLFCDPELNQKLDYLFIDEAGQVSLANTLAMCTSTKNIVLIGDQMQLSQPIKGVHPGISGKSTLEFLLEKYDTIPPEKGIFLDKTRRLNENICHYNSESFYDSRLQPDPVTKERYIKLNSKVLPNEGIVYLSMDHSNCSRKSNEELDKIKELTASFLGKPCKDNNKSPEAKLSIEDILVIAPFNMQANNLSRGLPKGARVGTIDKIQGQQAKIVIISMTSSDPDNIPRQKDFFFSRNRLNVAISRAQCLAIILFNPKLLNAACQKIEEMKLINNFCKLLKYEIKE